MNFILFAFVKCILNLGMQCTQKLTIFNLLILQIKINYHWKDVSQYIELAWDKRTNIIYNSA